MDPNIFTIELWFNVIQTAWMIVLIVVAAYHLAKEQVGTALDVLIAILAMYALYNVYWISYLVSAGTVEYSIIPVDVLEISMMLLASAMLGVGLDVKPKPNVLMWTVLPIMILYAYLFSSWNYTDFLTQFLKNIPYAILAVAIACYCENAPKQRLNVIFGTLLITLAGMLANAAIYDSETTWLYLAASFIMHMGTLYLLASAFMQLRAGRTSSLRLGVACLLASQLTLYCSVDLGYDIALLYPCLSTTVILAAIIQDSRRGLPTKTANKNWVFTEDALFQLTTGQKIKYGVILFAGGALACIVSGILSGTIAQILALDMDSAAVRVSPVVEEVMKICLLTAALFVLRPSPRYALAGAIVIGLGFSLCETAMMSTVGTPWFLVIRALSANAMHLACALSAGCAIILAKQSNWAFIIGLVSALSATVCFHGMFNLFMSLGGSWAAIAFALPWTIMTGAIVVVWNAKKRERQR